MVLGHGSGNGGNRQRHGVSLWDDENVLMELLVMVARL